ncbi:MAG TPA: DinB family protein, partial [Gemmatimonadaceae bacterium]
MANYSATELANAFRTVRGNTIQIAQDIPEDKYDFVPAPGVSSVATLLKHIACTSTFYYDIHRDKHVTTFKGYDFGAIMGKTRQAESVQRDKAAIVALLKSEGDDFANWLQSLSDAFLNETITDGMGAHPKSRLENLMGAKEHEMHHRGQLMLIERILGVVPHLTRQREERARAN